MGTRSFTTTKPPKGCPWNFSRGLYVFFTIAWMVYLGLEIYIRKEKLKSGKDASVGAQDTFIVLISLVILLMIYLAWRNCLVPPYSTFYKIAFVFIIFVIVFFGFSFTWIKDLGDVEHKKGIGAFHTWYGLVLMLTTLVVLGLQAFQIFGPKVRSTSGAIAVQRTASVPVVVGRTAGSEISDAEL